LKLGQFVDGIKDELDNDEQRLGADIIKRALSYPMRLVAYNSGVNGSVTVQKVLSENNPDYGFNAATGKFEDLMKSGIIDPTKVIRCCLENSVSVAKIFLTSDVVVCEIPEGEEPQTAGAGALDNSGYGM
jgi:chaperonin GroEL